MKPDVSMAAHELARRLREDLLPELAGFHANVAAMGAAMLEMIGDEWDGAAARLVAENRAIRALFGHAGALLDDKDLTQASQGEDKDLRISALTAANDTLRARLTDVQAHVEHADRKELASLETAIWDVLRDSVASRQIRSANF